MESVYESIARKIRASSQAGVSRHLGCRPGKKFFNPDALAAHQQLAGGLELPWWIPNYSIG